MQRDICPGLSLLATCIPDVVMGILAITLALSLSKKELACCSIFSALATSGSSQYLSPTTLPECFLKLQSAIYQKHSGMSRQGLVTRLWSTKAEAYQ